jgi:hypothetical protein
MTTCVVACKVCETCVCVYVKIFTVFPSNIALPVKFPLVFYSVSKIITGLFMY